jgi:hypothetical protein
MIDGAGGLLPVRTFDSVAELGLPTSYTTVSALTLAGLTYLPVLSNAISCNGELYFAAQGRLAKTTSAVVGSIPVSALAPSLCAVIPKSGTLTAPVFLKPTNSSTVYAVNNGVKFAISSPAELTALAGANPIVILALNSPFIAAIPDGPQSVYAGQLVKLASGASIYMIDGAGGAIPIASFDTVSAMGLSTAYSTVSPATMATLTVTPRALGAIATCGGEYYIAAQGELWKTSAAAIGALPFSPLAATLCAAIPKEPTALTTPSFIKSVNGATIYALNAGIKRPVGSWASLVSLVAGSPVVYISVSAAFVNAIPTGALIP